MTPKLADPWLAHVARSIPLLMGRAGGRPGPCANVAGPIVMIAAARVGQILCLELGIIDLIVPEPSEGGHRNPSEAALRLKTALEEELAIMKARSTKRVLRDRYRKFRKMGEYSSHFRVAFTQEVATLQGYVAQGVRLIRRRRRKKDSPPAEEGEKTE